MRTTRVIGLVILVVVTMTGNAQNQGVDYLRMVQVYASQRDPELADQPADSVYEGRLFSVVLKAKGNTAYRDYIRKQLPIEILYARDMRRMATGHYVGLDALNQSDFFERMNEVGEAGDRIIIDSPKAKPLFIWIAKEKSLHLSDIIHSAETRNVYYANTKIILDAPEIRPSAKGLALKGFIRLNNCQFVSLTALGGTREGTVLDSVIFPEVKITNSRNVDLSIHRCSIAKLEMTGITSTSLNFTNNVISDYFVLNGSISNVVMEQNTFRRDSQAMRSHENDARATLSGTFETMQLVNNTFDSFEVDLNPLVVDKQTRISGNVFGVSFAMEDFQFPNSSSEMPWEQFAGNKLSSSAAAGEIAMGGSGAMEGPYRRKIRSYQKLLNHYAEVGDIISANACSLEKMEIERSFLEEKYSQEGGFSNYLAWKLGALSVFYSRYGTESIAISSLTLVIVGFALARFKVRSNKQRTAVAQKRLAALVFSDIAGYTLMMGTDEGKAMKALGINRAAHIRLSKRFHGTLLKEMGDGMLCSFVTASDAVKFCIEIQREMTSKEFKLRMGIHIGEVAFSKGDVFGDGVNIASRLEHEAINGTIYISEAVYQNVRNQPDIMVEYVGERELKNVVGKVNVYQVKY